MNDIEAPLFLRRRISGLIASLLFLLVGAGCAATGRQPVSQGLQEPGGTTHLVEGVPFYPDSSYWCAPASLAGVLGYWGEEIRPAVIAEEIYSPSAKGALPSDLRWYASQQGYSATITEGNPDRLKKWLQKDVPVIVFVEYRNLPGSSAHFMVVLGHNSTGWIVNSATNEHQRIRRNRFRTLWARTNRLMLVVQPS